MNWGGREAMAGNDTEWEMTRKMGGRGRVYAGEIGGTYDSAEILRVNRLRRFYFISNYDKYLIIN